jgi:uncharacterized protein YbbK (DUF523 family)
MVKWAKMRVTELEKEDLCGFIFKSNSPSSGIERAERILAAILFKKLSIYCILLSGI